MHEDNEQNDISPKGQSDANAIRIEDINGQLHLQIKRINSSASRVAHQIEEEKVIAIVSCYINAIKSDINLTYSNLLRIKTYPKTQFSF